MGKPSLRCTSIHDALKNQYSFFIAALLLVAGIILMSGCGNADKTVMARTTVLSNGWKMQSSEKLAEIGGEAISMENFQNGEWEAYTSGLPIIPFYIVIIRI